MAKEQNVVFKGTVTREVYISTDFKVYGVAINQDEYPNIKLNRYGNVSVKGDIQSLDIGVEYEFTATEISDKYGVSYNVICAKGDMPTNVDDTYKFLRNIISETQASNLCKAYPNVIELIMNGEDDKIDFSKIHGIGPKTFERIKEKVITNFKLFGIVAKFDGNLSMSIIKKIYNKYHSIELVLEKINNEPYKTLTLISGIGFKKADEIILKMCDAGIIKFNFDIRTSADRCLACIVYELEENENNGNTKMRLSTLRKSCIDNVPECADSFDEAIQDENIYCDMEERYVALASTYKKEKVIANTILENVGKASNAWDFDVERYRNVDGVQLSDEQMNVLKVVCTNNICILNGFAGSGKSFSTKALIKMLDDNYKTYQILAPTGKASKVISDFTQRKASTIHKALCLRSDDDSEKYEDVSYKEIINADIVIVDEFSMVDVRLFYRLLSRIDFDKTKLLLIGDSAQLCSVGCGNLLHDFVNSKIIPAVTLTKIFRYGDGGLMKVATDIRNGMQYLQPQSRGKVTSFGAGKDYVFIDMPQEKIPEYAVATYKKLVDKGVDISDIQILTAKNVGDCGVLTLNSMIQKLVNKNYGSQQCFKVGNEEYYVGDQVVQKANNYNAIIYGNDEYDAFIANGETGVVVEISKHNIVIDFNGVKVVYGNKDMKDVSLGYAMTIHKSQGSGIKYVIVCTPKSHTFMLNSNILYVALTRTKERCIHLGEIRTINMAVRKKENMERSTFMPNLLKI